MASVTSIPTRGDQENSQPAVRLKNGMQGRSFGPTKSGIAIPLATPRRALGDVGNTLMTPGNITKKSSLLKHEHQTNYLHSKTPGAKLMTHSTPHGRTSSKPTDSLSLKHISKKQAFQVREDQSTSRFSKSSALEKDYFKKENMIPFTDEEKPLPRGQAISTVLKNVSQLYRGCLQPVGLIGNQATGCQTDVVVLETSKNTNTRPETDFICDWFGFDDYSDITSNVSSTCILQDVELPPIDIDLSDLGQP